jgi:hypothetical protein
MAEFCVVSAIASPKLNEVEGFSVLVILSLVGLLLHTIIVQIRRRLFFCETSSAALSDVPIEGAIK